MEQLLSFKLPDDFIDSYTDRTVNWGFKIGAGNSLGELTFLSKYSRRKDDGSKERWHECCRRVIEGMYSILKDHCKSNRTPWNEQKAQRSAQEAFDRMFQFKWTPPGRGLFVMGAPIVHRDKNSSPLQNCSFLSTEKLSCRSFYDATMPFVRMMEMSMLGVGVGFDTKGANKLTIYEPTDETETFVIEDDRESWADSLRAQLESYFFDNRPRIAFDYSKIRPAGAPIKTFGGTAGGPGPLRSLHESLGKLLDGREGQRITSSDIVDIMNLVGKCVVSGNTRRSAQLALGSIEDKEFLSLKNWDVNPERMGANGWGNLSNNSVAVNVGVEYDRIIDNLTLNGEPGLMFLDLARQYGRLVDPPNNKDYRVVGCNPCFHPDTIIETVDGPKRIVDITDPTLVYTKDHEGKLAVRKASASFLSRKDAKTLRIGLQNGDELIVTPEHKVMLRDGTWVEAQELQVNSSLEVLCRRRRGWRYSGVRLASQSVTEQVMEHRMIWEAVYGPIPDGYDIDHINRDHNDNRIENLRMLSHSEHAKLSRSQVPNDHQVHGPAGGFAFSGNHGKKLLIDAVYPPRSTNWVNQHTVISITEGPVTDVYDITVDDTHCMIANGVVAHNCAEQSLEHSECCTLVEVFLPHNESKEDFLRTLKFAYLYGKAVTLLPTQWPESNEVMQRNRRIGTSVSGSAQFAERYGWTELRTWLNDGYNAIQHRDNRYSEWLGVRESIKTTSVKPSGTVSLLAGVTPGVHWPVADTYIRRMRLSPGDPLVTVLTQAGYKVEPDVMDPINTVCVELPTRGPAVRTEREVSIWEKAYLAILHQRYWADNQVSVTLTFSPEEKDEIGPLLQATEGQLKSVSLLPLSEEGAYAQMPYERISDDLYENLTADVSPMDWTSLYAGDSLDAEGEAFCNNDTCLIPARP